MANSFGSEVLSLSCEIARNYRNTIKVYREQLGMTLHEADQKACEPPANLESFLHRPSEQISWGDFRELAEHAPEMIEPVWERIKAEARNELASGHRAARGVEYAGRPWERAQFLAIRQSFIADWHPRNGLEMSLIDMMAQSHTTYLHWLKRLTMLSMAEAERQDLRLDKTGTWEPPRLSDAEAIDRAAMMTDRFNRLFLRTLRALRDLRRYNPSVIVQNAEQVNVAHQQVNMLDT